MLINIPKNYKRTHGSLDDPICYLTGRDSSSSPIWNVLHLKSSLLDHPETFIDRKTRERIFVSHPYNVNPNELDEIRSVLGACGVDMIWFHDSWYHENTWRIELRNAKIRSAIANGESRKVLKQGRRSVLVG
jgi:hypothetical protein